MIDYFEIAGCLRFEILRPLQYLILHFRTQWHSSIIEHKSSLWIFLGRWLRLSTFIYNLSLIECSSGSKRRVTIHRIECLKVLLNMLDALSYFLEIRSLRSFILASNHWLWISRLHHDLRVNWVCYQLIQIILILLSLSLPSLSRLSYSSLFLCFFSFWRFCGLRLFDQ